MLTATPYRLERHRGCLIVALLPELNEVPWSEIERIGGELVQQLNGLESPQLIVDLSALNYMGSAQVALVVRLFKTIKEQNGRMVVANRDPMVFEVLELAGLDKLWTIVPSRDEALRLLGGTEDSAAPSKGGFVALLGMGCVAISLVGLLAILTQAAWLSPGQALTIEFAAAALAFLFGLIGVLNGAGSPRTLGTGVLVGGVALMLASVYGLGTMGGQQGALDAFARDAAPPAAHAVATLPAIVEQDESAAKDEAVPMPPIETDAPPADATQPSVP